MGDYLHRRPRYLALVLLVIAALGGLALNTVGRQEDPTITNLFATVLAPWPGAAPARVEALVTEPIEAALREVPEVDEVESVSREGLAVIRVTLADATPPGMVEDVWSRVRDKLSDAEAGLPLSAPAPVFENDRTGAFSAIVSIAAEPGTEASIGLLTRVAEALQERLRSLPNTKRVDLWGAAEEEIVVEVDPVRLASLGLTPADVAAAVSGADAKVPAGRVRGPASDYRIEVAGEIETLDRIREAPLAEGAAGSVVRVADIAAVSRSAREPAATFAFDGSRRAVLVAARVEDDRQVDRWSAALRTAVNDFRAAGPSGVSIDLVFDQSRYTLERLGDVAENMALGMALVVAVLFLSMGWRPALVVATTLPLASLASLAVLEKLGVVIHQMSVTGLIVALGLLVDAAIVTVDDVRRRLGEGTAPGLAAREAVGRLGVPLAASTVTTVLAFTPMAVLPGPAGDFVGAIALSVIVMLFVSLALALTVTPAFAARFLAGGGESRPAWWRDGLALPGFARGFGASLDAALRWRWIAMAAAAAPAVVGFLAFPTLTAQFFPGVERDQFHVQIELPAGSSIAATADAAMAAEALLRADPAVMATQWSVGRSAPPFYYNMMEDRDGDRGFAEALVTTASPEATEAAVPRLQAALDRALPGVQALVLGLKQGPPVAAPIELRLVGPDLATLRALGERARRLMSGTPDVIHTRADLSGAAPKLVLDLDEDRARLAGLTLAEAAAQLEAWAEGVTGGSLVEGTEEMPVRVRLSGEGRADAEALAALPVMPPGARAAAADGHWPAVPIRALGQPRLVPAEAAIARKDGERVNTVRAFVRHGALPEEALERVRVRLAAEPLPLPAGYRVEWGGDSDARGDTVRNLVSTLGLVLVATLASIVITFNSWRLSAITGVVAVLSMGLSLLALEVLRLPFGIQALIGVIGSVGVSINAAIIILTALQDDPDAAHGDRAAMRDVVMRQGRHIVSTTVTTFGGFLPLILAGGGFWPPFAVAIAGGVLLSAVTSFWFVPPAFALVTPAAPRRAASVATRTDAGLPAGRPLAAE